MSKKPLFLILTLALAFLIRPFQAQAMFCPVEKKSRNSKPAGSTQERRREADIATDNVAFHHGNATSSQAAQGRTPLAADPSKSNDFLIGAEKGAASSQESSLEEKITSWYEARSAIEAYFRAKSADFRAKRDQERFNNHAATESNRRVNELKSCAERAAELAVVNLQKKEQTFLVASLDASDEKLKEFKQKIEEIFALSLEEENTEQSSQEPPAAKKRRRSLGGEIANLKDSLQEAFQKMDTTSAEAFQAYLTRDDWRNLSEEDLSRPQVFSGSSKAIADMTQEEIEKELQGYSDVLHADHNAYSLHEMAQDLRAEADRKIYEALCQELALRRKMLAVNEDHQNARQSFEVGTTQGEQSVEVKEIAQGADDLVEIDFKIPEDAVYISLPSKDLLEEALEQAIRAETAYQVAWEAIQKYKTARLRWGKCVANLCATYQGNTNPHQYVDHVKAADADLVGLLWVGLGSSPGKSWKVKKGGKFEGTLHSQDMTRTYRPVCFKSHENIYKANYQSVTLTAEGNVLKSNAHITSIDVVTNEDWEKYIQKWKTYKN